MLQEFLTLPARLVARPALGFLALCCAGALGGCNAGEKDPRPPYQSTPGGPCTKCTGSTPSPDGGGGAGGDSSIEATGAIVSFTDDTFLTTSPFTELGTVLGQAALSAPWVEAVYDGSSYTLPGLLRGDAVWMAAQSDDRVRYWTTLSLQDTSKASVVVPLVANALLDEIFASSLASTPSTNSAQLVIQVLDGTGGGIAGVNLDVLQAEFVAFADQNSWSIVEDETTTTGLIFAGNVVAPEFPGEDVVISLSGRVRRVFPARLAQGAVTVVRVIASP